MFQIKRLNENKIKKNNLINYKINNNQNNKDQI